MNILGECRILWEWYHKLAILLIRILHTNTSEVISDKCRHLPVKLYEIKIYHALLLSILKQLADKGKQVYEVGFRVCCRLSKVTISVVDCHLSS